ncbi:hypothetical protein [Maribacter sp. R86514]|uniref:hypothetical protein n=1 Tax=Maribacter sp. R86514 TaxID=3093854 RepID=UPI0037C8598B
MKKNLIDINSWRSKFTINFWFIMIFLTFILMIKLALDWKNIIADNQYFLPIVLLATNIIAINIYIDFFLGYVNTKSHELILRKPFRKKIWVIKFEDIIKVNSYRVVYTIHKNMKIVVRDGKNGTKNYYVFKSNSLFGDDADFLWKSVLKRKKEMKDLETNEITPNK